MSGSFPESFKSAIVKLLLKKPFLDPENLGKYCPVSNLPFLSKLTEKVVLTNKLLYHLQSAYRSDPSTETALLKFAVTYCQLWTTIMLFFYFWVSPKKELKEQIFKTKKEREEDKYRKE